MILHTPFSLMQPATKRDLLVRLNDAIKSLYLLDPALAKNIKLPTWNLGGHLPTKELLESVRSMFPYTKELHDESFYQRTSLKKVVTSVLVLHDKETP